MLSPITDNGHTVAWVTAGPDGSPDPLLAAVVARCMARDAADRAQCDAIRRGELPPAPPAGRWSITDRD